MDLVTYCLFAFCTDVLNNVEYQNYDIEIQLDNLAHKTDTNFENMKYLLKVTKFNVKLQVENEIRKALVSPGYDALRNLHGQAAAAFAKGKDTNGTCYYGNKDQLVDAVRNAFLGLEPCVANLEYEYVELSSKAQSAKANAESLVAEVERLRSVCSGVSDETQHECYDIGFTELAKLIADSEYGYEQLYTAYHSTVALVPAALECVQQASAELKQQLDSILQDASDCYVQAGVA